MSQRTVSLDCPSCGAHIGEAVPGYMKAALCFCGELVAVTPADEQVMELTPVDFDVMEPSIA